MVVGCVSIGKERSLLNIYSCDLVERRVVAKTTGLMHIFPTVWLYPF